MQKVCEKKRISTYMRKESLHSKVGIATRMNKKTYTYVDKSLRISTHISKNPYILEQK